MAVSQIRDVQEMMRWFAEGRTPTWMAEEHERKYGVRLTPEAFINRHRRMGGERTLSIRHDGLLPWRVRPEHVSLFAPTMLRAYGRRQAGVKLSGRLESQLNSFVARLKRDGLVVHYEPALEDGFVLVPARKDVDLGLIREPNVTPAAKRTSSKSYRRRLGSTARIRSAS